MTDDQIQFSDSLGGGKTENCLFNRNTFVKVFAVIFLLWIPLVLIRYPGIQSGGVSAQFQQIMGMDTLARRLSPVIYDGHYISGHHPVLLTFLFGMFIRIGAEAGNVFPVFSGNG